MLVSGPLGSGSIFLAFRCDVALSHTLTPQATNIHSFYFVFRFLYQSEGEDSEAVRQGMNRVNPKYVLRNWMATLAYEKYDSTLPRSHSSCILTLTTYSFYLKILFDRAQEGDYSVIEELHELLLRPYEEQSPELAARWYQKTPSWARSTCSTSLHYTCNSTSNKIIFRVMRADMPGASFMS